MPKKKQTKEEVLQKELKAKVTEEHFFVATSKDGKTVSKGKTVLAALKNLKETLQKRAAQDGKKESSN